MQYILKYFFDLYNLHIALLCKVMVRYRCRLRNRPDREIRRNRLRKVLAYQVGKYSTRRAEIKKGMVVYGKNN